MPSQTQKQQHLCVYLVWKQVINIIFKLRDEANLQVEADTPGNYSDPDGT